MARPKRICTIPNCGKQHFGNGMCSAHYTRWRRYGDPNICGIRPGEAFADIEAALAVETDECIFWTRAKKPDGRGNIKYQGRFYTPARLVCILAYGEPPAPRLEAAHSCGNGHLSCINRRHLRWATSAENTADKLLHGTVARGWRLPHTKLTDGDVLEVRRLASIGVPHTDIAVKFGIAVKYVGELKRNHRKRVL